VHRDVAVHAMNEYRSLPDKTARNQILKVAEQLFRRRAFAVVREEDWSQGLYVFVLSSIAWREISSNFSSTQDRIDCDNVMRCLIELEDCSRDALKLDGFEFDDLRALAFDRRRFFDRVPRRQVCHEDEAKLNKKKEGVLRQLSKALNSLGVSSHLAKHIDPWSLPE
jgi:hypothetical protein